MNLRKTIGYTIGANAARNGQTLADTIAAQERRGGVTERDRGWIAEGFARYAPVCSMCRTHDCAAELNVCEQCDREEG